MAKDFRQKKMQKKPSLVFVDSLNVFSLFRATLFLRKTNTIYYFDSASFLGKCVLRFLNCTRLLKVKLCQVENHVGQIKDSNSARSLFQIRRDAIKMTDRVVKSHLVNNHFVNSLKCIWNHEKLFWYFTQKIDEETLKECSRIALIALIAWIVENSAIDRGVLLIKACFWKNHLKAYVNRKNINIKFYFQCVNLNKLNNLLGLLLNFIKYALCIIPKNIIKIIRCAFLLAPKKKFEFGQDLKKTNIGVCYYHRALNLDPDVRGEFFWLQHSKIPSDGLILYDYLYEKPLNKNVKQQLDARNINVFGRAPDIKFWVPPFASIVRFVALFAKIFSRFLMIFLSDFVVNTYLMSLVCHLFPRFIYYREFYSFHNIRVDVGPLNSKTMAHILALDSIGGVSIAYQISAGYLWNPLRTITFAEDVCCLFSGEYTQKWRDFNVPQQIYQSLGFVYDGLLTPDIQSTSNGLQKIKSQLIAVGVKHIICFFDEGFTKGFDWTFYFNNDEVLEDYQYLLKWIIKEPSLGLIVKPKRPKEVLFDHLKPIEALLEEALSTSRIFFITDDFGVSRYSPGMIAAYADLSIGHLTGTTASLEAAMVGTPSIMLDNFGIPHHPVYKWSDGNIIFQNWNSLKDAIEQFFSGSKECENLGDWSNFINYIINPNDGKGTERLANVFDYFYQGFRDGKKKDELMNDFSNF